MTVSLLYQLGTGFPQRGSRKKGGTVELNQESTSGAV